MSVANPKRIVSAITLLSGGKILRQPRVFAHQQREHASGHGVQRAQMTDGPLPGDFAQPVDHVVAGHAARFINNKKPVHILTLVRVDTLPTCPATDESKRWMADELERVRKALRELGKSLESLNGDSAPEDVHKLRTASRRVEAIAGVLGAADGKKSRRLVKAIEPVRKAAGGVRDMDVLLTRRAQAGVGIATANR